MSSSGKIQNINTLVKGGLMLKNVETATYKIVIKMIITGIIGYLIYTKFSDKSWIQTEGFLFLFYLIGAWLASSYPKNIKWEEHVVTFFVYILIYVVLKTSSWGFENILGLDTTNPLVAGYFVMVIFFSILVLLSRYTSLNIVKIFGWAMGLGTIGLFIFTYSVWGTLELCQFDQSEGGIRDPFYIVLPVYVSWAILFGLLFYADMSNWGQVKQSILAVAVLIAMGLVGYSWQRCKAAENIMKEQNEEEAEKTAIKDEPSWVNNGAHIATLAAWFNLFIGHRFSSAFFALMGYAILDQCAPRNDPRVIAVSSLLVIVLPISYFMSSVMSR